MLALPVPLGRTLITQGALAALKNVRQTPDEFLRRHALADWGELDDEDWARNDLALVEGARLLSAYRLRDSTRLWIITEWDRSQTTLLLPEEY